MLKINQKFVKVNDIFIRFIFVEKEFVDEKDVY